jgi:hypothetical protein
MPILLLSEMQAEVQMQTPLHVCPFGQTRASSSNNAISFHFHGLDSGKPAIYVWSGTQGT